MEKRKEQRIPEENKVVLSLCPISETQSSMDPFYCLTTDLSLGGARIMTDAPFPANTNVNLEIVLSKSRKRLLGSGKVRWVQSFYENRIFEIGVEFLELDPESIGAVLEHVHKAGMGRTPDA